MDISLGAWCLREIDGIPCETRIGCVRWVFLANCQHATYWCYLPLVAILCLPTAIPKLPFEPNMNPFSSESHIWISPLINHEFLLGNLRDIVLTFFFSNLGFWGVCSVPQEKAKEFKASNGFGADSDLKSQGPVLGLPWLVGSHMVGCCHFPGCKDGILEANEAKWKPSRIAQVSCRQFWSLLDARKVMRGEQSSITLCMEASYKGGA